MHDNGFPYFNLLHSHLQLNAQTSISIYDTSLMMLRIKLRSLLRCHTSSRIKGTIKDVAAELRAEYLETFFSKVLQRLIKQCQRMHGSCDRRSVCLFDFLHFFALFFESDAAITFQTCFEFGKSWLRNEHESTRWLAFAVPME